MTFKPTSGLTSGGLRNLQGVTAATLSTSDRKNLSKSSFVFPAKAPGSGSYPIPDLAHARNALSRAAGKPEEAAVKRAVYAKFPQLKNS
jgi:hypothetical protein